MGRSRKAVTEEQRYNIGNGATVVITFDPARRPKMRHDDTVVVIGDHVCADHHGERDYSPHVDMPVADRLYGGRHLNPERGGNLPLSPDDPRYAELRDRAKTNIEPAPKRVLTTEDVFREAGAVPIDMNTLLAVGAGAAEVPSE